MSYRGTLSILSLSVLTASVIAVAYCICSQYTSNPKKRRLRKEKEKSKEEDNVDNVKNPPKGGCVQVEESISSSGSFLVEKEAQSLTQALHTPDTERLEKVLVTISNAAAFTENQDLFRRVGCLEQLGLLLTKYSMAFQMGGDTAYPDVVHKIAGAINNLAVNGENQRYLKDCIPPLIEFSTSDHTTVQLASLQALTNLSVIDANHAPYTKLIQQLYRLLDTGPTNVGLQALKILVNLSTNAEMVPHLLAAKAPECLLEMLSMETEVACLLRWTTVIANVMNQVKEECITAPTLPCEYKAASPETMYTALYGVLGQPKLNSKVFLLTKHNDPQVRHQAARLYSVLT